MFQPPTAKLLTVLLALVTAGGIMAAKAPAEAKQYDYVTIEKLGTRLFISEGDEKYEETRNKDAYKDSHHYGPLYKLVNTYEAKGYEVYANDVVGYTSSGGTSIAHFVLLRKLK